MGLNIYRGIILLSVFCVLFSSFILPDPKVEELQKYCKENYDTKNLSDFIYVSIKEQKLYLIKNNAVVKSYPVSTSKYGVGELANTLKTPSGLHYIRDMQGAKTPLGGVLVNGKYTGKIANIESKAVSTGKDDITTRILWLMGCEHGVNRGQDKDSFCRLIYIHGTPEEGLIGRPASHGCVRLLNKDVIDLYNHVVLGMYVLIL